jgi:hypothetical protein
MINVWIYMGVLSVFLVGVAVYYMGYMDVGIILIFVAGVAAMVQMIREEIVSEKRRNKNV